MQPAYPDAVPIVLVHGWNGGEFTWPSPERLLVMEERLQRDIYLFTYRTGIFANRYPPLEVVEEQLNRYLAPYPQVDIVAHSMGGLVVRHYLAHHDTSQIRRVVFMATPHFGSNAAVILTGLGSALPQGNIQATEILPGSDFLWQLNSFEGDELKGIEVLNLFAEAPKLLDTDFVVPPRSAYLPWAANVKIAGGHRDLPGKLDRLPVIEAFLQRGELPDQLAAQPEEHEAWLHITEANGTSLRLVSGRYRVVDDHGVPSSSGIGECCSERSGLTPTGENTVIINDINPDYTYEFSGVGQGEALRFKGSELIDPARAVIMREVRLDQAPKSPANQERGTP